MKNKIKLSAQEFDRLALMIILKFAAERRDRADDDVGISQSDLKDYMTSKNLG